MKSVFTITSALVVILFVVVTSSHGQELFITGFDTSSGQLDVALSPTETTSEYSCLVEWQSTLTAESWKSSWYSPYDTFVSSNGVFSAEIPRFFRMSCTEGLTTNTPPTNYIVGEIVSSQITNGMISWTDTGDSNLVYYVEQSIGVDGPWVSQWPGQANVYTSEPVTNAFSVPLFFRVITIAESGELPW